MDSNLSMLRKTSTKMMTDFEDKCVPAGLKLIQYYIVFFDNIIAD